jgi:hypothetical protein
MSKTTKIILGSVVGVLALCCIGVVLVVTVGGTFLGQTLEEAMVESPEEAAEIGQSILDYETPAGYQEQGAINMFGNTMVFIAPEDGQGGMVFMLASFSSALVGNEEEMRDQLQESFSQQSSQSGNVNFSTVDTEEITINGETTTLTIFEGTDEDGTEMRQATATFSTEDDSLGMLMLMSQASEWDEEAKEAFLDSIE